MDTRFGAVRAADLNVNSDGFIKQCIVFLTRFETNAVYMKGWLCEASGAKPSADKLACMIDRMVLDKPLRVEGGGSLPARQDGEARVVPGGAGIADDRYARALRPDQQRRLRAAALVDAERAAAAVVFLRMI